MCVGRVMFLVAAFALGIPVMGNAQSAQHWQQRGYHRGSGDETRGARTSGDRGYRGEGYRLRQAPYSAQGSFLGPAP